MKISERLLFDESVRLFKQCIRLAGKTYHHVGTDRGIGQRKTHSLKLRRVVPGAVTAVHGAQDGIGPGLQRQMRMAGKPGCRATKFT